MKSFLDYVEGNSFLHRLNPITKAGIAVLICVACFSSNNVFFLIGMIGVNLVYGAVGGIFSQACKTLRALCLTSIVLFVLQPLFIHTGMVIIDLPLGLDITTDGLLLAVKVVLKVIGACLAFALMLHLTKISDLSNALVKTFGMPYKYVFTLTTAIRFVPVFLDEMSGIMEAQATRGVDFDTRNVFKKIGLIVPLCVPLLITSVKRIDSTAIAAEVRGFHLRTRTCGYKEYPFISQDFLILVAGVALVIVAFTTNIVL